MEHISMKYFEMQKFSFKKMRLNISSVKWRPFCLGLNVLMKIDGKVAEPIIFFILMGKHNSDAISLH